MDSDSIRKEVLKDLRIERLRQVRQQSHLRSQQQCGLYQKEKEELKQARKTEARTKKLKQTLNLTRGLQSSCCETAGSNRATEQN